MVDTWNGSHRLPAYFEWWYFHFVMADGAFINMVLHETDIFGLSDKPYLSLSVLLAGQPVGYLRRELNLTSIARQQPGLHVRKELITETNETISFDILFPGQAQFRGEIVKLASPLVIHDGILYQDRLTDRASHWVVPVPHATFTAILEMDDTIQHLAGTAYQDHQWGTLLIQEFVSDWVWGHFSNDQVAVVFFQILTQKGRWIERVAMITADGRFAGTALKTNFLHTLFRHNQLETFKNTIDVSFFNQQAQLSFEIKPASQMRSRLNEIQGQTLASYVRWSASGKYHAGRFSQPVYGITEYIRIRPALYGNVPGPEHR